MKNKPTIPYFPLYEIIFCILLSHGYNLNHPNHILDLWLAYFDKEDGGHGHIFPIFLLHTPFTHYFKQIKQYLRHFQLFHYRLVILLRQLHIIYHLEDRLYKKLSVFYCKERFFDVLDNQIELLNLFLYLAIFYFKRMVDGIQ